MDRSRGSAATAPAASTAAQARPAPKTIDPGAVAALRAMTAYLKSLGGFEVKLATQRSQVDDRGEGAHLRWRIDLQSQVVEHLRRGDEGFAKIRSLVYDGRRFSMFDPTSNLYTQFTAPATTLQTLDMLDDGYGIDLPLDDLFRWDQGDYRADQLESAARCVGLRPR